MVEIEVQECPSSLYHENFFITWLTVDGKFSNYMFFDNREDAEYMKQTIYKFFKDLGERDEK